MHLLVRQGLDQTQVLLEVGDRAIGMVEGLDDAVAVQQRGGGRGIGRSHHPTLPGIGQLELVVAGGVLGRGELRGILLGLGVRQGLPGGRDTVQVIVDAAVDAGIAELVLELEAVRELIVELRPDVGHLAVHAVGVVPVDGTRRAAAQDDAPVVLRARRRVRADVRAKGDAGRVVGVLHRQGDIEDVVVIEGLGGNLDEALAVLEGVLDVAHDLAAPVGIGESGIADAVVDAVPAADGEGRVLARRSGQPHLVLQGAVGAGREGPLARQVGAALAGDEVDERLGGVGREDVRRAAAQGLDTGHHQALAGVLVGGGVAQGRLGSHGQSVLGEHDVGVGAGKLDAADEDVLQALAAGGLGVEAGHDLQQLGRAAGRDLVDLAAVDGRDGDGGLEELAGRDRAGHGELLQPVDGRRGGRLFGFIVGLGGLLGRHREGSQAEAGEERGQGQGAGAACLRAGGHRVVHDC